MDFMNFVKAVYKAATPSVDFDAAETIDCTAHTLRMSDYEDILKDFAGDDRDLIFGCNMWMLQSGPKLTD